MTDENLNESIQIMYSNLKNVFDVTIEEFRTIVMGILSLKKGDSFYKDLINLQELPTYFEIDRLRKLKDYLKSAKIDDEIIKNMIIDTPEVILFANNLDSIFPLFKARDFKGYVILKDNNYKSYFYSNIPNKYYRFKYDEEKNKYVTEKDEKDKYFHENNTIVKSMLELLSRQDIKDYYGISNNSELKDNFYALSSEFNKRNYYFYKKENPLIGLKAKITTVKGDNLYHCDICSKGFIDPNDLVTHHIISLDTYGNDEIYNISCLCSSCYKKVKNNDISDDELIEALKLRIEKNLPEYLNKINSYFERYGKSNRR